MVDPDRWNGVPLAWAIDGANIAAILTIKPIEWADRWNPTH